MLTMQASLLDDHPQCSAQPEDLPASESGLRLRHVDAITPPGFMRARESMTEMSAGLESRRRAGDPGQATAPWVLCSPSPRRQSPTASPAFNCALEEELQWDCLEGTWPREEGQEYEKAYGSPTSQVRPSSYDEPEEFQRQGHLESSTPAFKKVLNLSLHCSIISIMGLT